MPFATLQIHDFKIEFLIDTGFNGALLLPMGIIQKCNLPQVGNVEYVMADGTVSHTPMFEAEVDWLDYKRKVNVVSSDADFALIGMELLTYAKTLMQPLKNILTIVPA